MKRYSPALVFLHWLLAIMISLGLVMGGNVLSEMPNSNPEKIQLLKFHMGGGIVILTLMIIRFIIRLVTSKPEEADIGNALLNKTSTLVHYALYVLVITLAASGIATANIAGLREIVFGASGAALPETFNHLAPRLAHGVISKVLAVLVLGHVLAALYHQFICKDALFSRMWFGKR